MSQPTPEEVENIKKNELDGWPMNKYIPRLCDAYLAQGKVLESKDAAIVMLGQEVGQLEIENQTLKDKLLRLETQP